MSKLKLNPKTLPDDQPGTVVLAELEKSETEKWRFYHSPYNEQIYFHARLFFVGKDGEWHPTRKGITFMGEFLPDMIEGFKAFIPAL